MNQNTSLRFLDQFPKSAPSSRNGEKSDSTDASAATAKEQNTPRFSLRDRRKNHSIAGISNLNL
jgi:hypothetical protein